MVMTTKFGIKMNQTIPRPQKEGMNPASFSTVGEEIKQLVLTLEQYKTFCISDLLIAYTWAKANGKRLAKAIRVRYQQENAHSADQQLAIMLQNKKILDRWASFETHNKALFVVRNLSSLEDQFNYLFSIVSNAEETTYKRRAIAQLGYLIRMTYVIGTQIMGDDLLCPEECTLITAPEWEVGYQLHLNKNRAYLEHRSPFFKQICIALLALVKQTEPAQSNSATAQARSFLPNIKDWFDMRELMHQYLFQAPIDHGKATSKPIQKKIITTPAPTNETSETSETSEEFVELQFNVRITQSGKVDIAKRLATHSLPATAVSKISTDVIQLLWKINHEIVNTVENSQMPALLTQIKAELTRDKEQALIDTELDTFLTSKVPSTVQLSEATLRFMQETLSKHKKA